MLLASVNLISVVRVFLLGTRESAGKCLCLFVLPGVSCDSCIKGNFRGLRFKCLICYDYDLCATCYEAGATNTRHTADHPMQCILTRSDYGWFLLKLFFEFLIVSNISICSVLDRHLLRRWNDQFRHTPVLLLSLLRQTRIHWNSIVRPCHHWTQWNTLRSGKTWNKLIP